MAVPIPQKYWFHYVPLLALVMLIDLLFVALPLTIQAVQAQQCETDNAALQAMQRANIKFLFANGEEIEFQVKFADTQFTRAGGFQRVCASTIAEQPILFVFDSETRPSFHMRNVVAPIDIAFIDHNGTIDSIQSMAPYVLGSNLRPLYRPRRPVIAALEVHPGFYLEHGIDKSVKVSWQAIKGF